MLRTNTLLFFIITLIFIGNSQILASQQSGQYISIVSYTINGQRYDVNMNDIKFTLPDLDKKEQPLRIIIEYSDNSEDYLVYNVDYNPPTSPQENSLLDNPNSSAQPTNQPSPEPSSSTPKTCTYSEAPRNCPDGGKRECIGIWQNGVCVWDSTGRIDPDCFETCNPSSSDTSSNNTGDTSSDDCQPSYTQCGKSFGLEDYEAEENQTVEITPCRLADGSMDYRKTILEGNPGNCPH